MFWRLFWGSFWQHFSAISISIFRCFGDRFQHGRQEPFWSLFEAILGSFWSPLAPFRHPLGHHSPPIGLLLPSFGSTWHSLVPWRRHLGFLWGRFGSLVPPRHHFDTTLERSQVHFLNGFGAAGRIWLYLAVRLLFQKDWERA